MMLAQWTHPVTWPEAAYLVMVVFIIALNAVVLFVALRRAKLDDLECTKYVVFTQDPFPKDVPEPAKPFYCELNYAKDHAFWRGLRHPRFGTHTRWMGVVLLIWLVWLVVVFGAFFRYHLNS